MPDFVQISDRVTVMWHDFVEGTCAIVSGDDLTMVIDAGAYPAHSRALARHLSSRGFTCDILGLTHGHGDHVAGVLGVDPDHVVCHPGTLGRALKAAETMASWAATEPADVAHSLTVRLQNTSCPDRVDLGGVVVDVIPTPGHTSDSLCFSVDGVLVAGDTVVTNIPPAFADGDSATLIASLRQLVETEWQGLIPGHGPGIPDGREASAWIAGQLKYLEDLRAVTTELFARYPASRVVDEAAARAELAGLPESDQIEKRLRNNARAMVSELLVES